MKSLKFILRCNICLFSKAILLVFKSYSFITQKHSFYPPKDDVLRCKRIAFEN
ncbi:hypothetical protein HMPREF9151_00178 [Hoylesella saccharolytica F0055]|uniref:Uncharacterized protein n=1 Tax=Hoylesella saccharolytica F0055 TaxID=1127699 RepID=L1NK38_9BACT|nr:hypothetical protein HMPREF9151_00178 [Hoylesella saccharolytica F0055]